MSQFGRCYTDKFLTSRGIALLPDPHMGRVFRAGVPLERRGEREQMQLADLEASLALPPWVRVHATMGDLFDGFHVGYDTLLRVYHRYRRAALAHPECLFVVLKGNHDSTRDALRRSAFDVFAELTESIPNIAIVAEEPLFHDGLAFLPWSAFHTADDIAALVTQPIDAAFGHWDVVSDGPNHVPAKALSAVTKRIYTGHEHLAGKSRIAGVDVVRIGSMQPYSHGEDPEHHLYVTLPLAEVVARLEDDPACFHMNCLRVALRPGEQPPERVDCLQLTTLPLNEDGEEPPPLEMAARAFDTTTMFEAVIEEHAVGPVVADELRDMLRQMA